MIYDKHKIKERRFEYGKQLYSRRQSNFHEQGSTTVENTEQPEEQEPETYFATRYVEQSTS